MEQAEPAQHSPNDADEGPALEALLRWYVAMGVDAVIGDTARDCFAQGHDRPGPAFPATAAPSLARVAERADGRTSLPLAAPASAEALIRRAEELAAAAATLEQLAAAWAALPGCGLAATATGMIFAAGTPGSRVMLVGGAPDSDDERGAQAFAGGKGRLLDAMLRAIGLTREEVYLANVVPWRPPGNRVPTPLELSLCLPFARRQIALAAPSLLVCLGERAAQPLLGSREPASRLRGRWVSFEGEATTVKTLVTFSLDYLLKQPLGKRRAWADLLMIADALATAG